VKPGRPSGVIPARLPALDVRTTAKDDLDTAAPPGSADSNTMDDESLSGKLEHEHADAACTKSHEDTNELNDNAEQQPDLTADPRDDESKHTQDLSTQLRYDTMRLSYQLKIISANI